jgi:C4-dicarboxylate-specific signal transduction histidine kinase
MIEFAGTHSFPRPVVTGWRWAASGALPGFIVALALVGCVAAVDYVTGYELRLAILYLVPIALSTWTGGRVAGVAIASAGSLCWMLSFRFAHVYSHPIFFYWEGLVMVAVFVTFVWLLARLRVALTRADERFLRVLEELHAGVYVVDADRGRVLYANPSLARMINKDPSALEAAELEAIFRNGVAGPSIQAPRQTLRVDETGFASDEVRDAATGRWYLVQTGPVPWSRNRHVSLRVVTDISEQKHAQQLKMQHRDMLHQTARLAALAEIASTLAHEINQPLMAIASYNDACLRLLRGHTDHRSDVMAALEKCRGQVNRAGRIISRMREFIQSRHPRPVHCDVNAVVSEALDLVGIQLEEGGVATRLLLADPLPLTRADSTLLAQVVVNLVQNAIDAMQPCVPGHRELTIATGLDPQGCILVSVADQGQGIPESIANALYRPFVTTKPRGLGLGLSICRSVVEAHDGRLWHCANSGPGCTFYFTIPPENG